MQPPLFDPADFRLPAGIAHVCAGGETAALRSHDDALLRYVADKSRGMPGRLAQDAEIEAARSGVAGLWGVIRAISASSPTWPRGSRSSPRVLIGMWAIRSASTRTNTRPSSARS